MQQLEEFLLTPWVYRTLVAAYVLTILSLVGIVLSENRNPVKSLAWVTVLLMFPVGGVVLYLFFGRSIKNKRMISRRNRKRLTELVKPLTEMPDLSKLPVEARQQIQLASSLTKSAFYTGNQVEILDSGEKFDALERDIRGAKKFINLQYYIFSDDKVGRRIKDALIDRARAGVKIRVIYDHIGSIKTKKKFFKEMQEAGIDVYPFFRVAFPVFATRINWRNHRKLVVIDGETGYIGGMNIADRYIDGGKFAKWRDAHLRIKGPAVGALQYSFAVDWRFMGRELLDDGMPESPPEILLPFGEDTGMHILRSGPTSEWSNISYMLLKAIGNAKRRVYIQTPYFLPTDALLRALQVAALSKVDVRVMIPKKSDSLLLTYSSRSYILECLRAGVKIYLYEGGMLHSKVVIVDDDFSSVGSANIDFRSFEHNFEANMFIYSHKVNSDLTKRFNDDMKESTRVKESEWRKRPIVHKAIESVLRLLSPVL